MTNSLNRNLPSSKTDILSPGTTKMASKDDKYIDENKLKKFRKKYKTL